ncbi:hypothetical protein B0H16DRAFT_201892 [Mycena metata]|uniref:Uncharacterized protein n=1 Tax=Mycena metata TaxID=1033252 RepID=A0AAD7I1C7_9AGAR|nr:hypothetical protein B0H16DRAFT_201892 [Mycena metata]
MQHPSSFPSSFPLCASPHFWPQIDPIASNAFSEDTIPHLLAFPPSSPNLCGLLTYSASHSPCTILSPAAALHHTDPTNTQDILLPPPHTSDHFPAAGDLQYAIPPDLITLTNISLSQSSSLEIYPLFSCFPPLLATYSLAFGHWTVVNSADGPPVLCSHSTRCVSTRSRGSSLVTEFRLFKFTSIRLLCSAASCSVYSEFNPNGVFVPRYIILP